METKTMAFTGPRPAKLCGWKHAAYKNLIDRLVIKLKGYYKDGIRKFISGGAQGFDQCAFAAVDKMINRFGYTDVQNVVYVPFQGQQERWVDEGCFGQREYQEMLDLATEVKILAPHPTDSKEYSKLLFDRNIAMVKDADIIFALYDKNDWRDSFGGTQYTMRKACEYRKELHQAKFVIRDNQVKLTRICIV